MSQSSLSFSEKTVECNYNRHKGSVFRPEHCTEIGKRIRLIRENHKLTREQAAEQIDIAEETVKYMEYGHSLTLENLVKVCDGYHCTFAEIVPDELLKYVSPLLSALTTIDEGKRTVIKAAIERICN